MSDLYQPGVCNIGPGEIRRRRNFAIAGGIAVIIFVFLFYGLSLPKNQRIIIIFPAMAFAVSFMQVRRRFCMGFGLSGLFNFGPLGQLNKIEDREARIADRRTVIKMAAESFLLASVITLIVVLLPA